MSLEQHHVAEAMVTTTPPISSGISKANAAAKHASLVSNYAEAFSDTYGVVGGVPFIYKTGPAWVQPTSGRDAQWPCLREMRPVSHSHPINTHWAGIVKKIDAHFTKVGIPLNIVAGLAYGNQGYEETFCKLVVVLGLPPTPFEFANVKAAANYVQETILTAAGFSDIQVAVREWEVNPQCAGPQLPSLDRLDDGDIAEFRHPFTSNPGLAVALLERQELEGTIGAYFQSPGNDVIFGLTCCHVAAPGHATTGLTVEQAAANHEAVIAIGSGAYKEGIAAITERIGTFEGIIRSEKDSIKWLGRRLGDGTCDFDTFVKKVRRAQEKVTTTEEDMHALASLNSWITDHLTLPEQRRIGHVYYAEPIAPSSTDPASAYTVDWAFVQLEEDAFKQPGFTGNQVYVGAPPLPPCSPIPSC